ncbi:MAG: class I SAM-dependent DNA methyltransferase, partial [Atopobiaceae bacterium]|nr:class I SAM-dependent DNA methyltransferase [Atopobiaceae bacterium]
MAGTKTEIQAFAQRWKGKGYEKGESVKFWIELQQAIGYQHVHTTLYEHHLDSGGFADVWLRDGNTIVEQKSLGVDLDKPELRQGAMKTPLDQALDYVDDLPRIEQPRFVVTCNFETFRVYDRDAWSKTLLPLHAFEFTLSELADHPEYLGFIVDSKNARLEKEKEVSIRAGALIGRLYDRLERKYIDPESPQSKHALNVLCVRMVFCLFCEDSGLFENNAFYDYLRDVPPAYMRQALRKLFRALDTPKAERDPYEEDIRAFPYVNGGLFHDEVEIPNFDQETKDFLLEDVSAAINWSEISPTIFGGIFESTLNPETRRQGGMHYTSPENIHKVIDPLFLDGLKREFADIQNDPDLTPRQRKNRYSNLHRKICSLTFFDPACGSGNFLTETYLCLRDLEDSLLSELAQGQMGFDLGESEGVAGDRVTLDQFYGIEINDFAVSVAEVALWISRLKANGKSMMLYNRDTGDFPLKEAATIVLGNALRMDWSDVLPAEQCNYIMGNPPFYGARMQTKEQKA